MPLSRHSLRSLPLKKRRYLFMGAGFVALSLCAGIATAFVRKQPSQDLPLQIISTPTAADFDAAPITPKSARMDSGTLAVEADYEASTPTGDTYYSAWQPLLTISSLEKTIAGVRIARIHLTHGVTNGKRTIIPPLHVPYSPDKWQFQVRPNTFDTLEEKSDDIILKVVNRDSPPTLDVAGRKQAFVTFQILNFRTAADLKDFDTTLYFTVEVLFSDGTKASRAFAKEVNGAILTKDAGVSLIFSKQLSYGKNQPL